MLLTKTTQANKNLNRYATFDAIKLQVLVNIKQCNAKEKAQEIKLNQ